MLKTAIAAPLGLISSAMSASASESPLATLGRQMHLPKLVDESLSVSSSSPELATLVAHYNKLKREQDEIIGGIDEIRSVPERPLSPKIAREEFSPRARHDLRMASDSFSLEDLEEKFNRMERSIEINAPFNHPKALERWRNEVAEERRRIIELFTARESAFEAWAESSGLNAAEARHDELGVEMGALEWQIIDLRCATLEEVQIKADFLLREWISEEEDESFVVRAVKSLATVTV